MKHTILGAGGSIGNALAFELLKNNEDVRLVSRRGFEIPGCESFRADLTSLKETVKSVKDSDIVYLCAGLPYDTKIWAETWPEIMRNSINACSSVNASLIFFDNVYMYGKVLGKMTETTPYNPSSKKGEIRAKVAKLLEDEIKQKNIKAIIARSADLYGPYATKSSIPYILAIEKLMNGKRAEWLIDSNNSHSFTYSIDAAKGMILLSKLEESYNQIWHLPTNCPISGEAFIHSIAYNLGIPPDYAVINKWQVKAVGLLNKSIAESYEMLYQYEFNYYFDSSKFNSFFDYSPISYYEGIHNTIEFLKQDKLNLYSAASQPYYKGKEFSNSLSV
jgi:nucleoside-diphosphate-sugar epimerase